jgi:pimeloyl-ACP methyl ester carboxylesterase
MPMFDIPAGAGSIHVVDLREESPEPSGTLPIVFLHGMVGHTGFWNSALAACADRRRAVAVDLRGHGNSAAPADGDYAVERCADDVLAVFDALGLDTVILVGHSYGAFVAIEVAARRPTAVRRLVLVDSPGDLTRAPERMRDEQLLPYLAALESDGWRRAVELTFDQALHGGTTTSAAAIHARLATMPQVAYVSMFRSMMTYEASASLGRYLAAPGASARAIVAPPNAWDFSLHVLVPALKHVVVPNVGHWIMLDAPDRFLAALDDAVAGI